MRQTEASHRATHFSQKSTAWCEDTEVRTLRLEDAEEHALESESASEVTKKFIVGVKSEKGREPTEHKLIRRWLSAVMA